MSSAVQVFLSARAWVNPAFYKRVFKVYELCLDSRQTAITIEDISAAGVRACLDQIGISRPVGGQGESRRPSFERENPSEVRTAIREQLDLALHRQQFLGEQGVFDANRAAELERVLPGTALASWPRCSVADYRATLVACWRTPDLAAAADELNIDSYEFEERLTHMAISRVSLSRRSQPQVRLRIQNLLGYLSLATWLETGRAP